MTRPSLTTTTRAVALLVILFGAGALQAWLLGIRSSNVSHGHSSGDLTDSYSEALAHGYPYLLGSPLSSGIISGQDLSAFEGQNFVYYGIGPFAVVFVPWLKLTGTFLSAAVCILAALLAGYLAYGYTLWLCFRQDQRTVVSWLLPAGFLAIIVGSGTWPLLDLARINEMESACAYGATALAVAALATAHALGVRKGPALAGAGFFAGLAVACRPNGFPAVAVISGVAVYLAWTGPGSRRDQTKNLVAYAAPLFAIAVALAIWNQARFHNLFEFGLRYGTGAVSHPAFAVPAAGNIVYNLHRYLSGEIRWSDYFPFIAGAKEGPIPLPTKTHEPVDQIYGCFVLFPVLAYTAFAAWKKPKLSGVLLLAAAGNLVLLSTLGFGSFRYASDYLGLLSLVAGIGVICAGLLAARIGRVAAVALLLPLLAWSGAAGWWQMAAASRSSHPADFEQQRLFAALAGPFNHLAYRTENLRRAGPRAIRLTLTLPADKYGLDEPLLVYGDPGAEDFIYFRYATLGAIQVGFESIGHGGPVTAPLRIDYARPHVIDISLGNLLPPDDHPLLLPLAASDRSLARRYLRIAIDGQVVLEDSVELHPIRSRMFWGESPDDPAFGRRFTGKIVRLERPKMRDVGIYPQWDRSLFGPLSFRVEIQPGRAQTSQPLVSLGYRPTGGILTLDPLSADGARLKWTGYGSPACFSQPIAWSYGQFHTVEFNTGALLPPVASSLWSTQVPIEAREQMKQYLRCSIDGRVVWELRLATPDASPSSIVLGANGLALPGIAATIDGQIVAVQRKPW